MPFNFVRYDDLVYLTMCFALVAECTFEDTGLCGWTNIHGDNFDWSRASGSTASIGTGPRFDHTYGTSQGSV